MTTVTAKNRILIIMVVILLLTNLLMLFFFVWLKPGSRHDGRGKRGVAIFLEEQVGFTEDQMKSYQELREQHWGRMKPVLGDIRTTKERFYNLLARAAVPDSVLQQAADSIGRRQSAIDLLTFQHFREVRALCTPEQRPRFDSLVHQVMLKMSGPYRRGNRPDAQTGKTRP
ncbi:periplasmic heavy metal sensor [Chitinophaga pendula]|uniref:Spy/CpxP family protein refolding chaperone n=1 Tax=Chitinophaga TaxID=79328 RepID=UPI000BB01C08|nr:MULTISPECIES: periplasmic heavy metal sensor [Chitinophaga]ASZ11589.1 hypothetical protein CK934_11780 [Chitinophaga sp. MD30]UCJ05401.1 periplasmic heavy metal sensor [Chitinophaga pendula]